MTEPTLPNLNTLHRCLKCGELKPLNEFAKDSHTKSGYRRVCRSCFNQNALANKKKLEQARTEALSTVSYPNDPLRINPEHKQTITESGVFVYIDTCATCKHYSAFYGGCLIRESSNNQSVVKLASVPMSVSAGEKCKMWVAK